MYKVFINDKPLILTNKIEKETDFQIFLLESVDIHKLILKFYHNKIEKAILYHPDEKLILKKLKERIQVNKAGGGLVKNSDGKVLFIYRNGKWDLPKGGVEKGENIENTAIREVEEETGVRDLQIVKKLLKTYHVFRRNNKFQLKVTQWYEMKTNYQGKLHAQQEEGIDQVEWLSPNEIEKALKNSYENIKLLFESKKLSI